MSLPQNYLQEHVFLYYFLSHEKTTYKITHCINQFSISKHSKLSIQNSLLLFSIKHQINIHS